MHVTLTLITIKGAMGYGEKKKSPLGFYMPNTTQLLELLLFPSSLGLPQLLG